MKIFSIDKIISNNLNFKKENEFFSSISCARCKFLLGMKIKNYFFLKKKIKVREHKELQMNLIGLKQDLLNKTKDQINKFKFTETNININIDKHTKDSLEKFKYTNKKYDITFIIHKIEGRVFLLGKNGFYNHVNETLISKHNNNLWFILIVKETEENMKNNVCEKMIEELINKGEQEQLGYYYHNNRIIIINDFHFEKDFQNKQQLLKDIILSNYQISNTKDEKIEFLPENQEEKEKDFELFNKIVGYEVNGGNNNIFSKCSML